MWGKLSLLARPGAVVVQRSSINLRLAATRSLAAVPQPKSGTSEDLVKAAVHKMMIQQHQEAGVSPEALRKASYALQSKLEQVKACLSDVQEEVEDREAELQTTDMALEQAAAAYVDLLDLVRAADENTAGEFKALREASAAQIREFRQELDQYKTSD